MLSLYMDEHVSGAITRGVRRRGMDALTALQDGHDETPDEEVLARATELQRIVFTQDEDFLVIGSAAQEAGRDFSGIVYAHQLRVTIGEAIRDLELICTVLSPDEMRNTIQFLPI